jgi:hypothetical protein
VSSSQRRLPRRAAPPAAPLVAALALAALPGAMLVAAAAPLSAQPEAPRATGRVAGTVLGEGGRPVPGAQVLVVGTRLGTVTDDQGKYNVGGVPTGAQSVRVQRIGFTPREQPVTVAAGRWRRSTSRSSPRPRSSPPCRWSATPPSSGAT